MGLRVVDLIDHGYVNVDALVPGYMYTYFERDGAVQDLIESARSAGMPDCGIESILRGRGDMSDDEIKEALRQSARDLVFPDRV